MSLTTRISELVIRIATEFKSVKTIISGNNTGSLTSLTTSVKTSIVAAINSLKEFVDTKQNSLGYTPENVINKGAANGYASLDAGGKVPASQLPEYVDDILDGTFLSATAFKKPGTGNYVPSAGVLYVDTTSNVAYRWSGSAYIGLGAGSGALILGSTSETAHRGDHGVAAYTHSTSTGNPHGTTYAQLAGTVPFYTKAEIGDVETNFVIGFESALL